MLLDGEYGEKDVFVGVPVLLGKKRRRACAGAASDC